jgi:hypothetical protein
MRVESTLILLLLGLFNLLQGQRHHILGHGMM